MSPYTIIQLHHEWNICEKTLYNYIEGGIFEFSNVNNMDLRRQTCRKLPKQSAAKYKKREDRSYLHKTADEMVKGVDYLESILSRTLFDKNVCVLLTDRGTEFSYIRRIFSKFFPV